jgi:hypothetical protein
MVLGVVQFLPRLRSAVTYRERVTPTMICSEMAGSRAYSPFVNPGYYAE